MKKIIAALLAITMPIWLLPAMITFVIAFALSQTYESMLDLLTFLEKK